jgi:hypothetical protein
VRRVYRGAVTAALRPIDESALAPLLLVEAVETADPEGHLLAPAERSRATLEARAAHPGDAVAALAARAEWLARHLQARLPAVDAVLRPPRVPAGVALAVLAVAAGLGLSSSALGPARHVNILSVPLLGLLGWNLAVYAGLAGARLAGLGRPRAEAGGPRAGGAWARGLAWLAERRGATALAAPGETADTVRRALAAYSRAWWRVLGPAWSARVRALLHGGAAALAAGTVVGMYLRGIAFEYAATWESTFLGPDAVRALLGVLLGPASLLLGTPLPDAPGLAALRAPGAGPAAAWIHRYAVTAALVVVVPRLVLAAAATWRARRLTARPPLDLDAPYYRRLLAAERGDTARVEVVPYSCHLEPRRAEALTATLRDLAGHRARVHLRDPVEYGAEAPDLLGPDETAGEPALEEWRVVLFSLAQPPETEVHGDLLAHLRDWAVGGAGRRLLVVVDDAAYRERLGGTGTGAQRLRERRQAWDRVAGRAGLPIAHVDLAATPDDHARLAAVGAGLWPGAGGPGGPE